MTSEFFFLDRQFCLLIKKINQETNSKIVIVSDQNNSISIQDPGIMDEMIPFSVMKCKYIGGKRNYSIQCQKVKLEKQSK